jgi:hypothetical protein
MYLKGVQKMSQAISALNGEGWIKAEDRVQSRNGGMPMKWDAQKYQLGSYNHDQVRVWCVRDAVWQTFRLSLKGVSTQVKLMRLEWWWRNKMQVASTAEQQERVRCQVTNYLYALKRGGQLGDNLEVRR